MIKVKCFKQNIILNNVVNFYFRSDNEYTIYFTTIDYKPVGEISLSKTSKIKAQDIIDYINNQVISNLSHMNILIDINKFIEDFK